jgi:predicted porin
MLQKSNTPPQLTCSATLAVDNAHQDSLTYWEFSLGRLLLLSTKLKNFKEFYMQKKIIALAVVAAAFSAPAFADTTVYGILDGAIANISKTNMKNDLQVISGGLSTSRFGVKHVEDIEGGMKVVGVLEYKLDIANNAAIGVSSTAGLAARQQMLALAGDFGTVATGFLQTTGYDLASKFDPTAGSAVDTAAAVNPSTLINTSARANRAAAYISPNMGGVVVAFNHAFDVASTGAVASNVSTVAGNKTTANLFSVTYDAGPLSVGGAYASTSNDGNSFNKTTDTILGGSYDLGMAKLLGSYTTTKTDNALGTDKAIALHAVAPVGSNAVVFTYAKNTINSTVAADDTKGFTLAYLYNMSKMTTAYGAIQKLSKDGVTTTDTTVLAVGLRKKF